MNTRLLFLALTIPALIFCTKPAGNEEGEENNNVEQEETGQPSKPTYHEPIFNRYSEDPAD